jgi:nicotinamidase-related amidase
MVKQALLIIDIQNGSFSEPCFQAEEIVRRVNVLSTLFRALDFPVIIIQHDGTKLNEFIPHTHDWKLIDTLEVSPSDILISKSANDAFYETALQSKLNEWNVRDIVVTGTATDFCIDSTVQSALVKDYNVTIISDGHTTTDKPLLSAERLIQHYNWVWKNLTPTKGKIQVMKTDQFLKANSKQ